MVLRVLNFGIEAVVEMRRGCEEHTQSCWVRNEVEVFTESQSCPSLIMAPCYVEVLFLHQPAVFLSFRATGESLSETVALHIAGLHSRVPLRKELGLKKHLNYWYRMESLPGKFSKNVARTLGLQMKCFHRPLLMCWMWWFSLHELKNGSHGHCGTT